MSELWIHTRHGYALDLIDPQPEQISIRDIASALSRICRYTGHTASHHSVAEHCVAVSLAVPTAFAFEALMHDAHEAYTGDVASPIKRAVGPAWSEFEQRIARAVRSKFRLPLEVSPEVAEADRRMLITEAPALLPWPPPRDWGIDAEPYGNDLSPVCMTAEEAAAAFMMRFNEVCPRDAYGKIAEQSQRENDRILDAAREKWRTVIEGAVAGYRANHPDDTATDAQLAESFLAALFAVGIVSKTEDGLYALPAIDASVDDFAALSRDWAN